MDQKIILSEKSVIGQFNLLILDSEKRKLRKNVKNFVDIEITSERKKFRISKSKSKKFQNEHNSTQQWADYM